MKTINGVGTRYLGIEGPDREGNYTATVWMVIFYAPLIPLRREKVRFIALPHQSLGQKFLQGRITRQYVVISRLTLSLKSIIKTYLYGWILIPLFLFGPIGILIYLNEVLFKFLLPNKIVSAVAATAFIVSWLVISVWKLADWDENRGYK